MRKKIAVFANGWSDDYLRTVVGGIQKCAKENKVDVYVFTEFSSGSFTPEMVGELNVQNLPELQDFDGTIMLSNTFNFQHAIYQLKFRLDQVGIPSISLEYEVDGMAFMGTENTSGMLQLTDHLIEEHGVKDILFICGISDNKESNERLAAVQKSLGKHGLSLKQENILFGGFSDAVAMDQFAIWYEKYKRLPDAVMCANDIMALGVINYCEQHGIDVPGDLKVTGYDNIEPARVNTPSVTTVGRDWDSLGYEAMTYILNKIDGKDVPATKLMNSYMVKGESCGCKVEEDEKRNTLSRSEFGKKKVSMDFDSHNRAMYLYLRDAKDVDEVYAAFTNFLRTGHEYEGENIAICMVKPFFEDLDPAALPKNGYGDEVYVMCDIRKGIPSPKKTIPSNQIIPWENDEDEEGHFYVIVSLHSDDKTMGYAVFEDNFRIIDNYILYTWTRHVNQYLEQVRTNMRVGLLTEKLRVLSVTDSLTGIYNRMGYKEFAIPFLEKNKEMHKDSLLMIADVNRMKVINDQFGHSCGDLALIVVADVLKKTLPGWVLVRYGGDEFLMVGDCENEKEAATIRRKVYNALRREVIRQNIYFPLTISLGSIIIDQSSTVSVEDCFKRADRSMYRIKKKHHRQDELDELLTN